MTAHLVVKHTFWELQMSPEELEFNVEQRRNRAFTDFCIEYSNSSKSEDLDSPTSTAIGSSVASLDASPKRSEASSEAGDVKERWADIADDTDDVQVPMRPPGTLFVPASTIMRPPGTLLVPCMPVCSPLEAQMAVAVRTAKVRVVETKTACTKGKVHTVQRQPQQAKTSCNPCDRTTLVFRKLQVDVTRSSLLQMLEEAGFKGLYDFVYLPMDFKKEKVFGYAIVNFVDNACAEQASFHFGGEDANIDWSDSNQGLDELIQRYRDSPIMHSSMPDMCKPIIFCNGMATQFPHPTKHVKPLSKN